MLDSKVPKAVYSFLLATTVMLFTACGGSSSGSGEGAGPDNTDPQDPPVESFSPSPKDISSAKVVDANNNSLGLADISILSADSTGSNSAEIQALSFASLNLPSLEDFSTAPTVMTNESGVLSFAFQNGTWFIAFTKNGVTSIQKLTITPENASGESVLISSLSCTESECQDVAGAAIVGSLSGVVYNNEGPVAGAQIGLSGGEATNGTFTSALTNESGEFSLTYNVSSELKTALENATIRVVADGYKTLAQSISLESGNLSGLNLKINADTAGSVVWKETFESDSPTVDGWAVEGGHNEATTWQKFQAGQNLTNGLADGTEVKLAPNDTTGGALPDPANGQFAYWYGDKTQGNFIGEQVENNELKGGTSSEPHRGSLTSPPINLSDLDASSPLSLTFKTWWEIESENPNENGFDLMSIQVSTDGISFQTIARLNPLSDPESGDSFNREAIPYTNNGFNNRPSWTSQEPIALEGLAGEETVYIRWEFDTVDELFNGFRGWFIDDVVIDQSEGTFPLFDDSFIDPELCEEFGGCEDFGLLSVQPVTKSLPSEENPRWSPSPIR